MPLLIKRKCLAQRKLTTTAVTLLYQIPSSVSYTIIDTIIVCNIDTAARTYSMFINPTGSTAADNDNHSVLDTKVLNAAIHDIFEFDSNGGIVLESPSASILMKAQTANTIVVTLFGKEITET